MTPQRWQQIDQLFHAALAREASQRAAFLAQVCVDDEPLRRELESLISFHEQAESFIETPASDVAAALLAKGQVKLEVGTQITHYSVLSSLGAGGMSEVYLAEDTRLGRKIALKLLPAKFTIDAERVRRFEQEARAASALNHPNIVTIHEIGTSNSLHFIATEFIEGETLRTSLARGALKFNEALDIVTQVASALAAAHVTGTVHRDIKPENIMLRPDGFVKVLDFGLAKLLEKQNQSALGFEEATIKQNQTAKGVILGTVNYMSPEQAKGEVVDERTDVFSLGVVIFEMITGKTPFAGNSGSETFANLINAEPQPLSRFAANVPTELERIVGKMLRKNKDVRYQTMTEVLKDLTDLRGNLSPKATWLRKLHSGSAKTTDSLQLTTDEAHQAAAHTHYNVWLRLRRQNPLAVFLFAALVIGTVMLSYYFFNPKQGVLAFQLGRAERLTSNGNSSWPAISPDGKFVAYVLREAPNRSAIELMQLETGSSQQILPPVEVRHLGGLSFSPDSNHLFFVKSEKFGALQMLYRIPVSGGLPTQILKDLSSYGLSRDGARLAFVRNSRSAGESYLMISNADGSGEYKLATRKLDQPFYSLHWSPSGRTIAAAVGSAEVSGRRMYPVELSVAEGTEREITAFRWNFLGTVLWLANESGFIANGREDSAGTNWVWHISHSSGEVRRLTDDEAMYGVSNQTPDSKTLVAQTVELKTNIWTAPIAEGGVSPAALARQITTGNDGGYVTYLPDGRLLFTSANRLSQNDIWVMNADGSARKQLTANAGTNTLPVASKDGRYIVFESDRGGKINIWRMDADGGNPRQLTFGDNEKGPDISPDSKWVVYTSGDDSTLWRVPVEGGATQQLTDNDWRASQISPDGKWILSSYIEPKPDAQRKLGLLPFDGGKPVKTFELPPDIPWSLYYRWTPDGQAFIFVGAREGVWNVWKQPISGGRPVQLTDFKSTEPIRGPNFSPDGKQIVFSRGDWMFDIFLIRVKE